MPADNLPSPAPAPESRGTWFTGTTAAFLAQFILLALAGWVRRHALNPDGVAYLRIAGYYAHGQTNLAVSGYWGPLLSRLMTPLLLAGIPPLATARIVMALTAVFFLRGCLAVFRAFELPEIQQRIGMWVGVVLSVCWSVENITPDLLAAGLAGFAIAIMVKLVAQSSLANAVWAGFLWGMAFLAKAVAWPLAMMVIVGTAFVQWRGARAQAGAIARNAVIMVIALGCLAGPWVAVISKKYGHFTISRSAQLNHAMAGPSDMDRFYPLDRDLQAPEAGRVTFWEDPDLPYPDWSPLASVGNLRHQGAVILKNLPRVAFMLTGVCLLFPWLVVVFAAQGCRSEPRQTLAAQRWWWAWLPVAALAATYLGGNLLISEQRYFYAAFPFLFVLCAAGILDGQAPRWKIWLVALAFLLPTLARPTTWRPPAATAGECAWRLAEKLSALGISGPVASSAQMPGGRAGMYVAFHLGAPWYGDARQASASEFETSGARLVIVNRDLPVCRDLDRDTNFVDLDGRLFASPEVAAHFPLKAYQSTQPAAGESAGSGRN
jgi:hypothetical protein